ncbi:MAG: pantoate--beta-alanine ligase [Rhodothermia bacterium]|nr:pantoate--beta-alanine ligase [Rhodothermia bacterium]
MKIFQTIAEAQAFSNAQLRAGRRLALVPTMGALHEGHLRLVDEAFRHADAVVVSIFVNPTQFGPNEDFSRYPRTLEADLAALQARGVSGVFTPTVAEMYPLNDQTWVEVHGLDAHLCGPFRPGHFRGVTTVVARLFLACRPQVAVFGLKDAQQFLILRRMVRDLHFGIEMVGMETVRESDGLAMSSRNRYLGEAEREKAGIISKAVLLGRDLVTAGERRPDVVEKAMRDAMASVEGVSVQYAEIVDAEQLQRPNLILPETEYLVAVAGFLGQTRLIDNQFVSTRGSLSAPSSL